MLAVAYLVALATIFAAFRAVPVCSTEALELQ